MPTSEPTVIPITGSVDPALLQGLVTLATNLANAGAATEQAGQRAQGAFASWSNLGRSIGSFATNANQILLFGQNAFAAAGHVADLVAEDQRLSEASARLHLDFDQAAGGAGRFTDEVDVMTAAGSFAARGIRLTQTELNALTHAAARNAQQTGGETSRSLETLTSALERGRARGLAPFGEQLAATTAHGYTLREGLAALVEQEAHTTTATDDAHTSMAALADATGDAARGFATLAANNLGLGDLVPTLTRQLGELGRALHDINAPENTPEARAQAARRNSQMGDYARERAVLAEQVQRHGLDPSLLPGIDVGNQSADQLRQQTAAMRQLAARAGGPSADGGGILIGGVDPLATPIDLDRRGLERELRELRDQVNGERLQLAKDAARADAPTDAHARDHQVTANGGASAAAARERRERLQAFRDEAGKERAREALARHEGIVPAGESDARHDREEMAAAASEKGRDQAERMRQHPGEDASSMADSLADKERSRLDTLREAHESYTGRLAELHGEQIHGAQSAAEFTSKSFDTMGAALGKHVQALVDGRESAGQAFKGMVADTLSSIGQQAIVKGAMEFAEGASALAGIYTAPLAPGHFAAGALYMGVGALASIAGAALQPSSASPARAPAGPTQGGAGGALPPSSQGSNGGNSVTVIHQYYAPTFGGRQGSDAEVGEHLARFTDADNARRRR